MKENNNKRGILLMIGSMIMFAIADALVKVSTQSIPPAQALFHLVGGAFILYLLMAIVQGDRLLDSRAFLPILITRYLSEVLGMVGMVTALAYVPISSVGAITQAAPLLAAVGAVVFLKEQVGWRRWGSIIVGFIGVLLIVQPGAVAFDAVILWPILALFALSIRDLTTRMVPPDMSSTSLATFTMAAAVPFTIAWVFFHGGDLVPATTNWLVTIPMIIFGAIGYRLLIASIRMAEVSIVMPFRYSRIIFLLVIGIFVFDEKPNALMLSGATLIMLSGIYLMWREKLSK